ncbi:unnamed protein product [Rotaria sp. Silwood1]|nr:unnamed protein product [Rotaria sp. Silwood1]CAF1375557.1 unnamed protein product [Rotaria sp. Silwood1]CAF3582110.1 unnamed protein product [Rotaria sp. Silwood1]CAF4601096.1 unnamed protein product [Rotaria sp. Silwood1]CAF4618611.1 unnamed protein product [Rotaria sp. Silwood1]
MSSNLFYDSDDERDSFDIERRQIESFQKIFLSASIESSDDDEEGIIDGTKIPSSTKLKSRARHSFLDISTLSSSSDQEQQIDDDNNNNQNEENPFDIISKSIDIENIKPKKKKKSLGVSKSKIHLDTTDIYDQEDDSNHSRNSFTNKIDDNDIQLSKTKTNNKSKARKPTKAAVLETERKMQQLNRSEHLVLPTFVPKPLETWHALEKRSRQELMNEIRSKNPSFTPQDPELPELPVVNIESTVMSTLADLTKLIDDKPSKSSNTLDKLSRFLNPDILKKKPTMSNIMKESNTMIDLTDTKKTPNHPTVKSTLNISLDCIKSPSSSKKLFEMQKQLGIRMRAKRAAMLAENPTNIPNKEDDDDDDNDNDNEEEDKEVDEDSTDSRNENNDANSEIISNMDKENDNLQVDEETRDIITDDEDIEEVIEEKENSNPSVDPNRPSLKTILTRLESSDESVQIQPAEQNGRTEWFNSTRPVQFDSELEMLCSGAFGEENLIPPSQNCKSVEPMAFSPLPITQIEEEEEPDMEIRRTKVRQLIDDDDDENGSNKQLNNGSNNVEESDEDDEEEAQEDEDLEDNEELVDYKKQLFEMEAEESGSEVDEKDKDMNDENDSDENEEPDEELQKFIDTAAIEIDEDEADNLAKVHLKIKAKEDEQQLKLLKEQYLDFEGDDDGRRIKISKVPIDDDEEDEDNDPDYNSEAGEEDEEDDEDDDLINLKDRMSELERQRSMQDNQAEELHLDEDLDSIGQNSSMFQKGLALKQKKLQSITTTHIETTTQTITDSNTKKTNQTRSVTLSSVLLAKRFSTTLLAPVNRNNITVANLNNTDETTITTKKQHNPRRHVFSTNLTTISANENQNPVQSTTSSGEKRSNSADKSPTTNIKRFKQSTTITTKTNESSASVFSALAFSNTRR